MNSALIIFELLPDELRFYKLSDASEKELRLLAQANGLIQGGDLSDDEDSIMEAAQQLLHSRADQLAVWQLPESGPYTSVFNFGLLG